MVLLGGIGIRVRFRVLGEAEGEEVDVLGEDRGALRRELDELGTGGAANGLSVALGKLEETVLAGRVAASEYPRNCGVAVVVL